MSANKRVKCMSAADFNEFCKKAKAYNQPNLISMFILTTKSLCLLCSCKGGC